MTILNLIIIIYTTVLTFSALYAPQPLLPILTDFFQIDKSTAALSTTVTLIPLSIAPVIYGVILEKVTSKQVLKITIFLLAISEYLISKSHTYDFFLAIRIFQGILVPAILTSLMTYVSIIADSKNIQKFMSYYIASTILGGFSGRAVSGFISVNFGWRYSFLYLFISLSICFILLNFLSADSRLNVKKIGLNTIVNLIKISNYNKMYIAIFCAFYVFAGLLNFLPFRLTEISQEMGEFKIGLMYSGYLAGIFVTLNSFKFIKLFGSELKSIFFGFILYIAAVIMFNIHSVKAIFVVMFVFCGAMFLIHSVASGYLNKISKDKKGLINGLYVSSYYAGGSIGSFLPGFVYKYLGWNFFLLSLAVILMIGILNLIRK